MAAPYNVALWSPVNLALFKWLCESSALEALRLLKLAGASTGGPWP
jgi:hypothetical protein